MIVCGWCARLTASLDRCTTCGHEDPSRPWTQRGMTAPSPPAESGRPRLDPRDVRRRLDEARHALGAGATVEAIAEYLDISPKTVRRWRQLAG